MRRKHKGRFPAWTTRGLKREGVIIDNVSDTPGLLPSAWFAEVAQISCTPVYFYIHFN